MSARYSEVFDDGDGDSHEVPYKSEAKEGFIGSSIRNVARTGSRALETVLGAPGDIASLLNIPSKKIYEAISGKPGVEYEDTLLSKALPTSSQLKSSHNRASKGYLSPESEGERFLDDVAETFTSVASGGGLLKGGAKAVLGKAPSLLKGTSVGKSAAVSLASNIGSEIVKQTSGDQSKADLAKAGLMFITSVAEPKKASKYIHSLYQKSSQLRGSGSVPARSLNEQARSLKNELMKGGRSPSKNPAIAKVDEIIQTTARGGQFPVEELERTKTAINELRSNLYSQFEKDKSGLAQSKRYINQVAHMVDKEISQYGKSNPEYYKAYRQANEAKGVFEQSKGISRWIDQKVLGNKYTWPAAVGLGLTSPSSLVPAGIGAGVTYGGLKTGEYLYRIAKSPVLRKMYGETLKAATEENAVAFLQNLSKLQQKIEKQDSKLSKPSGRFQEVIED